MKEYFLTRDANVEDIDFLVEAIVNAEKGHRDILPYCALFNIPEDELSSVLKKIFRENITDFDFSLRNFMIAEHEGCPVAAYAGWVEGIRRNAVTIIKNECF